MYDTIEIRVRKVCDYRKWTALKTEGSVPARDNKEATKIAKRYINNDVYEVRWNWSGSPQGHYVSGSHSAREKHLNGETNG